MLSADNIERINDQIENKLRELDRAFLSTHEREEIRKDLTVLVDLLRIYKHPKEQSELSSSEDMIEMLRRRA